MGKLNCRGVASDGSTCLYCFVIQDLVCYGCRWVAVDGGEVENGTLVWRGDGGRLVWESEVCVAVLGMVHGGSVAVD